MKARILIEVDGNAVPVGHQVASLYESDLAAMIAIEMRWVSALLDRKLANGEPISFLLAKDDQNE